MQPNTKGWRVNGGSALDDGGQSTESEAESSYQGWSDTWYVVFYLLWHGPPPSFSVVCRPQSLIV